MNTEIELHTAGALAVAPEQTEWTEQQLAVLRSAGVNEEVTPAELSAFLHECQRTKLDPFTRQIYLIGRYDNQAKRKVFRSQTGIDGYRVIAHRVVREQRADLAYDDTLWCGPDGVWRDVWLFEKPPAAAKVTVRKNGKPFPGIATLAEYAARYPDGNPYPMWRRMPANQLAKCAEALALRKAFPQDLAGIYTAEEMEQADARDQAAQARAAQPQDGRAARAANRPLATGDQKRDLAILCGQKLGMTERKARLTAMSHRFKRLIGSFDEMFADEAATAIRELGAREDFVPPRTQEVFDALHKAIADADLDSIGQVQSSVTEARDAGTIPQIDWEQLSDFAEQRTNALIADAAGESGWDPADGDSSDHGNAEQLQGVGA